jgi:hypothetical protein
MVEEHSLALGLEVGEQVFHLQAQDLEMGRTEHVDPLEVHALERLLDWTAVRHCCQSLRMAVADQRFWKLTNQAQTHRGAYPYSELAMGASADSVDLPCSG